MSGEIQEPHALGMLLLGLCGLATVALLGLAYVRGPMRVVVPEHVGAAPGQRDLAWLGTWAVRGALLSVLGVALLDPAIRVPEEPAAGSGIDLVVALDTSGSMDALDGTLDGARVSRLALAKRAVATLVRARAGDRIGLVVFGQRAYTQAPLTLDHRQVLRALDRVRIGDAGDSTAMGDAIGLAIRRLRSEGARKDAERILVVITDGRQNSGQISPETAARLAVREGVRTHTVGIGTSRVVPFAPASGSAPARFERIDLDRSALLRLASATGGEFFDARRPSDVLQVAERIHELETQPVPAPPSFRRVSILPEVLALALLLVVLDVGWNFGAMRRLP